MKTLKGILPVVTDISPITCDIRDEAGNGIVGFTATYTDGTFTNIVRSFNSETREAAHSEISTLILSLENRLVVSQASNPQNTEAQKKSNKSKRRLL